MVTAGPRRMVRRKSTMKPQGLNAGRSSTKNPGNSIEMRPATARQGCLKTLA
jgi:hypothetical protein